MESIPPRQTLRHIQSTLTARGIRPKSKLGQNFLIDLNLLDLIARTAELSRSDLALEIGAGTGSLTARLAELAGGVVSVEVDSALYAVARETIGEQPHVRLRRADALRNKNELDPALLAEVDALAVGFGTKSLKLVANLPYAVATPVIANVLIGERDFERMVVTVQWEIAARLTAVPRTAQYGALSVLVQSLAEVTIVRRLAPTVFWPRPEVESAIVRIDPVARRKRRLGNVRSFREFLRDLYTHRRKNLRGALSGWPTGRRDKADIDRLLAELHLPGTARAEVLSVEQHQKLWQAWEQQKSKTRTS